jgi:hypothetical protein
MKTDGTQLRFLYLDTRKRKMAEKKFYKPHLSKTAAPEKVQGPALLGMKLATRTPSKAHKCESANCAKCPKEPSKPEMLKKIRDLEGKTIVGLDFGQTFTVAVSAFQIDVEKQIEHLENPGTQAHDHIFKKNHNNLTVKAKAFKV